MRFVGLRPAPDGLTLLPRSSAASEYAEIVIRAGPATRLDVQFALVLHGLRLGLSNGLRNNFAPVRSTDRLTAFFLLEQVGDHFAAGSQTDLVTLDLGNQAARNEMMMLLVSDTAVSANQLDAVFLDAVDGAKMDTVGADH